ncbi:MAG: hypothetical protein Q9182_000763, partial [Xanthomendoza sp. 2 TL-2023]
TPRFGSLPNPYPVPGKPYSLHFTGYAGLPRDEVRGCLSQAYKQVMQVIEEGYGSTFIGDPGLRQSYYGVVFALVLGSDSPSYSSSLTYDDAKEILNAFWLKSNEEGSRAWKAQIDYTRGGAELGVAVIWRRHQ